ncbi:hypothetical protein [Xanthobacter autotrophicus]|uniref:hypothetical protein n=1 Tax=Xanthobacter autotrophicus TaxID=280 RepID=UPI0037271017
MSEFGEIPSLYQKLRLLIDHGHYADWTALAAAFGVNSPSTVQAWGHGGARQKKDWVPPKHQGKLLEVFAKAFAERHYSAPRIRQVILLPISDFEAELKGASFARLEEVIAQVGKTNACAVFTHSSRLGMVRRHGARQREPQCTIPMGTPFRIEARTPIESGHACALQQVGTLWGSVDVSFEASSHRLHVPGFTEDGALDFVEESDQPGLHRFIILQSRTALSAALLANLRQDSVLDPRTLGELAAVFAALKDEHRRIYVVDIAFTEPGRPAAPADAT